MKKPILNQVVIVGVGLIGGSLGLAIKKRRLAKFVVGVFRRKPSLDQALSLRAVDAGTMDLARGVKGADLVILCAPVSVIVRQLKEIAPFLKKGAIVMDVGSSKGEINRTARRFLKKNKFVGCHPMAGSENGGVEFADGHLFEKSVCFITHRNKKVTQLWKVLGAKPVYIKEAVHDAWVAKASHLPHALAFALFQSILRRGDPADHPHNPSLQDLARLASSNPDLWTDIFMSNQKELLKAIGEFQKSLSSFEKALRVKNRSKLARFISHANRQAS